MLIGIGFSCRISYSSVSYLYVRLPGLGKGELFFLLSLTCNYVVSVRRGFLFLLVLIIGCVISLWLILCLPYNYNVSCKENILSTSDYSIIVILKIHSSDIRNYNITDTYVPQNNQAINEENCVKQKLPTEMKDQRDTLCFNLACNRCTLTIH